MKFTRSAESYTEQWEKNEIRNFLRWFKRWGLKEDRANLPRDEIHLIDLINHRDHMACRELNRRDSFTTPGPVSKLSFPFRSRREIGDSDWHHIPFDDLR